MASYASSDGTATPPPKPPATKLLVVVTAANELQATSARIELEKRSLPAHTKTIAVADPAGRRIGSGGGTLNALKAAHDLLGDAWLDDRLILIIHSGGDSQRAPSQSVCGKAWSLLPTVPPKACLLYTSPSPRDKRQSRMPSSA